MAICGKKLTHSEIENSEALRIIATSGQSAKLPLQLYMDYITMKGEEEPIRLCDHIVSHENASDVRLSQLAWHGVHMSNLVHMH